MDDLIDDAIKALCQMPENVQATVARAILDYCSGEDNELQFTDEQGRRN